MKHISINVNMEKWLGKWNSLSFLKFLKDDGKAYGDGGKTTHSQKNYLVFYSLRMILTFIVVVIGEVKSS
jgi:hypothetical protein